MALLNAVLASDFKLSEVDFVTAGCAVSFLFAETVRGSAGCGAAVLSGCVCSGDDSTTGTGAVGAFCRFKWTIIPAVTATQTIIKATTNVFMFSFREVEV